ncbi:MAG: enoyl-CoA hydratase/isomerase [Alphaproteobacteria bacterium]|nr:enoyl-CoA hydratase/isomerase [Alphaproteobacteria bacterium]
MLPTAPLGLPKCKTLALKRRGGTLHVTLNQPESRNALSQEMISDLERAFGVAEADRTVRTVVLRGAGGNFCAGGDLRQFQAAGTETPPKSIAESPHYKGALKLAYLMQAINTAPAVVIGAFEGGTLGAGFGFLCVVDIAIASDDAVFGITGNMYGVPPGPIVPQVVERLGLPLARRMALSGIKLGARDAFALGLIHHLAADSASLDKRVAQIVADVHRCAPNANRVTKDLLLQNAKVTSDQMAEMGANAFARALHGTEVNEGTTAFFEKREPRWAVSDDDGGEKK